MLQTQTIDPGTLTLLRELMSLPSLANFWLVGGTNLSLRYGHRLSIDIDLFSIESFETQDINDLLSSHFGDRYSLIAAPRIGIFCYIDNVKVDIIRYTFEPIKPLQTIDGIRMYSAEDIAAMKIATILSRGKKKDFWDLYELFQHFTYPEVLDFYHKKHPDQQLLIAIAHALIYFDDADESEEPISLKGQTWKTVKASIQKTVSNYLK